MTCNNDVRNPIFQKNGKWFFFDETWCDVNVAGPFDSSEIAENMLIKYCDEYLCDKENKLK